MFAPGNDARIRRRLKELDGEIKGLFRTTEAGTGLVRRWNELSQEIRELEGRLSLAQSRQATAQENRLGPF